MIVLGLFNGPSTGHVALDRLGVRVDKYYSSEIDKYAIETAQKNYPDTIQLGNILQWRDWVIPDKISLITAGFSCQPYSVAGKRQGLDDPRGGVIVDAMLEVVEHYKADNLMFENVPGLLSIDGGNTFRAILWKLNSIGYAVDWMKINSCLVSAQNRERLYIVARRVELCTSSYCSYRVPIASDNARSFNYALFSSEAVEVFNSGLCQPEDKGVLLKDILEKDVPEKYFMNVDFDSIRNLVGLAEASTSCCVAMRGHNPDNPLSRESGLPTQQMLEARGDNKTNCLTTVQKDNLIFERAVPEFVVVSKDLLVKKNQDKASCLTGGAHSGGNHSDMDLLLLTEKGSKCEGRIRRLTPVECERLQTFKDNYTEGVSASQRYKMLGNSWTVDVIVHVLGILLKGFI